VILTKRKVLITPPAERVLVVDDEHSRLRAMFAEGVFDGVMPLFTSDGLSAIGAICAEKWDVLFLDYDLNTVDEHEREVNGLHVALALIAQPWKPMAVIIHSVNFKGAKKVEAVLEDADINVIRTPIMAFTKWAPPRNS
jgi:CheY-like chemotaxis protein